ncbi:MAG: invasion associated locus B family protein [Alphaproteobacteria bacterium]|nr:invasion associated locus B family protein [Alphaproteobacteria bacterium]MCD8520133.1 invasion associated locus B family protein [Alphaproteobacteria bacterium]MCD8571078.1 invasion associated locus B family protein [Alphaproteobacteria bacterium]
MLRYFLIMLALCVVGVAPARAEDPELIGRHGEWMAYKFMENGTKVCYMASQPKSAKGNYSKRGDVFALITHRPSENTKNVFSYITGYTYKPESEVTVTIGKETFTLFTDNDRAWTPDDVTDQALTNALRKGSQMVVKGVSSRGTNTTDTFSLKGSGAAHDAITKECGL